MEKIIFTIAALVLLTGCTKTEPIEQETQAPPMTPAFDSASTENSSSKSKFNSEEKVRSLLPISEANELFQNYYSEPFTISEIESGNNNYVYILKCNDRELSETNTFISKLMIEVLRYGHSYKKLDKNFANETFIYENEDSAETFFNQITNSPHYSDNWKYFIPEIENGAIIYGPSNSVKTQAGFEAAIFLQGDQFIQVRFSSSFLVDQNINAAQTELLARETINKITDNIGDI